jgi:hypothetical protein
MAVDYWLTCIRRNTLRETGQTTVSLPESMQLLIVISYKNQMNIDVCLKMKSQHLNKTLFPILISV